MSRESIFDPEGHQTEHSGSRYMGPRADNLSHLPPDISDGDVGEEEAADLQELAEAVDDDRSERDKGTQP